PVTGIVRHLDDQCFGCQYCILACPYDAPKFHLEKGIVRKCDMCADRLRDGEPPACVQACPHEAIRIRIVDRAEVVSLAEGGGFLPTAPDPLYTLPSTRYVSDRPRQGPMQAADHHREEPEHAHTPLVVMLVLTQAAAGGFLMDFVGRVAGYSVSPLLPVSSLILGLGGISASLLHLGRPLFAYRAVIGLRHSWLSREVLAFGMFAKVAMVHVTLAFLRPGFALLSGGAVAVAGLAAVGCSVMVYHAVRRPFWNAGITGPKFLGTAVVLGLGAVFVGSAGAPSVGLAFAGAGLARILIDFQVFRHLRDPRLSPLRRSAELMKGPLASLTWVRLGLGVVGSMVLPVLTIAPGSSLPEPARVALASLALVTALLGELSERALFFQAVVRPKMPGGVHA
ncbi:MAG TPA: DmsC/YnfH family molybdoenzyme membrane anchor subunit, partial [Isosphaeraceae bacterium]|nr:DmsC/YnfH family molybdoenzyme membrane anchor subunit [Isosphaeraceae bacterium]